MDNQDTKPSLAEMKEKIRKKESDKYFNEGPGVDRSSKAEKILFNDGFDAAWDCLMSLDDKPLKCDVCGRETDDPWHYSGGDSRHLHACDHCKDKVIFTDYVWTPKDGVGYGMFMSVDTPWFTGRSDPMIGEIHIKVHPASVFSMVLANCESGDEEVLNELCAVLPGHIRVGMVEHVDNLLVLCHTGRAIFTREDHWLLFNGRYFGQIRKKDTAEGGQDLMCLFSVVDRLFSNINACVTAASLASLSENKEWASMFQTLCEKGNGPGTAMTNFVAMAVDMAVKQREEINGLQIAHSNSLYRVEYNHRTVTVLSIMAVARYGACVIVREIFPTDVRIKNCVAYCDRTNTLCVRPGATAVVLPLPNGLDERTRRVYSGLAHALADYLQCLIEEVCSAIHFSTSMIDVARAKRNPAGVDQTTSLSPGDL